MQATSAPVIYCTLQHLSVQESFHMIKECENTPREAKYNCNKETVASMEISGSAKTASNVFSMLGSGKSNTRDMQWNLS